ncbi:MAG: DUF2784 domain-containing protein [Candidatus Pacebacteria bacterium]|nr:DUF2784 domain-containing protein [Candidatus Paceibacterota bacterium]
MLYMLAADLVVLLHLLFVVVAVAGGLLVLKWRWFAWLHVPAAVWAVLIEWAGWICPLTPVEIWLRRQGNGSAYSGGFVEHYILPILYPVDLTRAVQFILGGIVLALNIAIYAWVAARWKWSSEVDPERH